MLRHALVVLVVGAAGAASAFTLTFRATEGEDKDRFDTGITAAAATAAVVAGVLTWGRLELSRRQHRLSVDRDLTERYGRAVDQMGSHDPLIRVGGVFAMERFALDAFALSGRQQDTDWRMALDLLAEFARDHSHRSRPVPKATPTNVRPADEVSRSDNGGDSQVTTAKAEVLAAVRVLGRFRRRVGQEIDGRFELAEIVVPNADLFGADLTGANLRGAKLHQARLHYANLTGANLTGADLSDARMHAANFTKANLTDANFTGAELSDANFTGANLTGAQLTESDLIGADLRGVELTNTELSDTKFREADLTGADLRGVDLHLTDLTDADLRGASYNERTRWPSGFEPPTSEAP